MDELKEKNKTKTATIRNVFPTSAHVVAREYYTVHATTMTGMHTTGVHFKTIFAVNTFQLCMMTVKSAYSEKHTRRRVAMPRSRRVGNTMRVVTLYIARHTRRQNAYVTNCAAVSAQLRKAINTARCVCANPKLFEQT